MTGNPHTHAPRNHLATSAVRSLAHTGHTWRRVSTLASRLGTLSRHRQSPLSSAATRTPRATSRPATAQWGSDSQSRTRNSGNAGPAR